MFATRSAATAALGVVLSASGTAAASDGVTVHLFEWQWDDVARECETFLGPKGFSAVQVSPPNEHITGSEWWARYQPVSYQLVSRSGNRAAFADMVQRCNAAGVAVYADAVINHTAALNGGGVGVGGTQWSYKDHPMYSSWDYHDTCTIRQSDYADDPWRVRNCELSGLPDLDTGSDYVRDTLAGYLNDLTSLGVSGVRIDAAKHMSPGDIAAVQSRVSGIDYWYQEVIDQGGEAISAGEYVGNGAVTEFRYGSELARVFRDGNLAWLSEFGESWGFLASSDALVFVDNHDNQRGHGGGGGVITHKDGSLYDLANVFMLAWPYGRPRLMSSYAFTDTDAGPPGTPVHDGDSVNCFGDTWKCEHRWRPIANMVAFRNAVGGAPVAHWWDNGGDQIAFARDGAGFVVINREGNALNRSFQTGLPAGEYCDVIHAAMEDGTCSSPQVTVDGNGWAQISVDAMDAVALHVNAQLQDSAGESADVAFACQNGETYMGQSVYVTGDGAELGDWRLADAVKLDPADYPTWTGTIALPAETTVEWKCVKREETDATAGVVWEGGDNTTVQTSVEGNVSTTGSF